MSRPRRVPRWWLLVEPGKARPLISSQRFLRGEPLGKLPATTPRCVPKKVLCVLPVTTPAPVGVGLVGIVFEDGEIAPPFLPGRRALLDVIEERARGRGAEVPSV